MLLLELLGRAGDVLLAAGSSTVDVIVTLAGGVPLDARFLT